MIKITKPGKTIRYKFICPVCGCEYTADLEDLEQCGISYECNCPNCSKLNFSTRIEYEED